MFKSKHIFDERKGEAARVINQYPDRFPVVLQQADGCTLPPMKKVKFLLPKQNGLTVGEFACILRKYITLKECDTMFLFLEHDFSIPRPGDMLHTLYTNYKDQDQFLYLLYSGQATFGFHKQI
jgi:GABA(A) receptor-associated protein